MKSNQQKREEGEIRNAEWRELTVQQQLAELDRRLGPGLGARRQRAKFAKEAE
jgi:hypothetical protein